MTDPSSLLARVMAATGPDRELDVRIGMFESGIAQNEDVLSQIGVAGSGWTPREDEWPPYTSSVDAALGLVERLLPGWLWSVDTMSVPPGKWSKVKRQPQAQLAEPIVTQFGDGIGIRAQVQAATPALAILSALLSALASQAQSA